MGRNQATKIERWWAELERLARVLGRVGPDEVCCEGLTQRQTAILRTLVQQEGARLSDLAQASGVSPSAMTRVIEKLERRGLVRRVRGAQPDGRAAMVRITPEGRKLRERLDGLMEERTQAIFGAVPNEQRERVLQALCVLNCAMENAPCCGLNEPVGRELSAVSYQPPAKNIRVVKKV